MSVSYIKGDGFDYPDTLLSPIETAMYSAATYSYAMAVGKLETPIVIRNAHIATTAVWNCIAQYDANALDANTRQRPIVDQLPDDKYLNSYTRTLCLQYSYLKVMNNIYPKAVPYMTTLYTLWGLPNINSPILPEINQDVVDCNHNKECLTELAISNNFEPEYMANIIAYEIIKYYENDGWNADGLFQNEDGDECTANCYPYRDITGYVPEPQGCDDKKKRGRKGYDESDIDDAWVPLLETDNNGYFWRHEHVTPHIGHTVKPLILDEYRKAKDPQYDYDLEIELLLERLRNLAVNDTQKITVEFFDNKLLVRGAIQRAFLAQYKDSITLEDYANFLIGISAAEYDTMLQAWNQKVEYDLIRPTTIIQRLGKQQITTYGGPYQGIKTIDAQDFEPYQRIMPHSEYPSGSACLCIGYADFTKEYLFQEYGDDNLYNMYSFEPAGSSSIEPGVTPKEDLLLDIGDLDNMYYLCSESRLWGGMHFTASIHAGKDICSGIGTMAYDYSLQLKENSDFLGKIHVNDPRTDVTDPITILGLVATLTYFDAFDVNDLVNGNPAFSPIVVTFLQQFMPSINANNGYDLWLQIINELKALNSVDGDMF